MIIDEKKSPIPATGYNAWFATEHGEFSLPVVALVPSANCEPTGVDGEYSEWTDWEPAVISPFGSLVGVHDRPVIGLVGGEYIGITPASLDAEAALAMLELQKVFGPDRAPSFPFNPDDMVGRVTAARQELKRRLAARAA